MTEWAKQTTRRIIPLLLALSSAWLHAEGAWVKGPLRFPFVLAKVGVFGRRGTLTAAGGLDLPCGQTAWIAHRLAGGESLSEEAGKKLGVNLNHFLAPRCFGAVEVDLEPLPGPPAWLAPFLRGLRSALKPKYLLRLAVPPITGKTLPGLAWKPAAAEEILNAIDGLDLMLYDTGLVDMYVYSSVITEASALAADWLGRFPKKTILLGFPAYPDRTRLHRQEVENLGVVESALRTLPPDRARAFCEPRLSWAYYAGWTLSESDRREAAAIAQWRDTICRR